MRLRTRPTRMAVAAAVALLTGAAAACSSGGSAGTPAGGGTAAASSTIKLGLIPDPAGPFSSSFTSSAKGVEAYVDKVNAAGGIDGHKLSYVVADTTSTIQGA